MRFDKIVFGFVDALILAGTLGRLLVTVLFGRDFWW
jgi:hypothetical protein